MFSRRTLLSGVACLLASASVGVSHVVAKTVETPALPQRFVVGTTLIADILSVVPRPMHRSSRSRKG